MKKIVNSFFFCTIGCLVISCGSGTNENSKVEVKDSVVYKKEDFPKSEIIESITNKMDAQQSYVLYLPAVYDKNKPFPVIYIFDAHGTGKLPVSMYKELAEKYGYILVGSNDSKNGNSWEQTADIFEKMMTDTRNRLNIDAQKIYVMGFSGGARIANGITILNGNVAGAICVGAVSPSRNSKFPRNNYSIISIAGNDDMNYNEIIRYHMIELAGHNLKNAVVTYNGKHEWCPKEVMEEAFLWIEFNEMRKNISQKKNEIINNSITGKQDELKKLMDDKKYLQAYKLCKKTINFYDGLTDLTSFYEAYKQLQKMKELDVALQNEEKQLQEEDRLKAEYIRNLQSKDLAWWQKEVVAMNAKTKSSKEEEEVKHMYKRLLEYLSLACYSQTFGLLSQNNIQGAEYFGKLYLTVDPTNKEASYLMAVISAKKGKQKEMESYFAKAIANGFDDISRVGADTTFNKYKTEKSFQDILAKINKSTDN